MKFTLDDLEVELLKGEGYITLRVHDPDTLATYYKNIYEDSVESLTNGLFQSLEELYVALLEAFQRVSKKVKITMDEDGVMTYTYNTFIGTIKKQFSFQIQLVEEGFEMINKVKDQLEVLSDKINDCNETFKKLEAVAFGEDGSLVSILIEKVKRLEDRVLELENTIKTTLAQNQQTTG